MAGALKAVSASKMPNRWVKTLGVLAFATAGAISVNAARGAAIASDSAANYTVAGGWTGNGGTGFTAWTFSPTTPPSRAVPFIGSSGATGIDTSSQSWGSDTTNVSNNTTIGRNFVAYRGFTVDPNHPAQPADLFAGQTISATMYNDVVHQYDPTIKGESSLFLYSGGNGNSAGTQRFRIRFYNPVASDTASANYEYAILDSTGTHVSTIPYTTTALQVTVNLTGPNAYTATLTDLNNNANTYTLSGTLSGTASVDPFNTHIDTVGVASYIAGNAYFNSLTVIPEPTSLAMIGILGAGLLVRRRRKPLAV